jgi:hypothetical protein
MGVIALSRKKLKRGVGGSSDRFIRLPHYLVKSPAWRTMPDGAKALLIEVWLRHNGVNNGEISFGCGEAGKLLGCSTPKAWRMFKILIERSFLIVVRDACFDTKNKAARTWRITAEKCGDKPATKDFMKWRPATTEPRDENHFTVSPMKLDDFTHENLSPESPVSVSPMKPTNPKSTDPRFHPCNTYNIPGRLHQTRLAADWKPNRSTNRATRDAGLRYNDIPEALARFRHHYLGSGEFSADWNVTWIDFVRSLLDERDADGNLPRRTADDL